MKDSINRQTERLSDEDFETIRIHLNAYKENLCNQHRWKEAEEYQRLIDRFMVFASTDAVHEYTEHWILDIDNDYPVMMRTGWRCSKCGRRESYGRTPYCPYCGAKMEAKR